MPYIMFADFPLTIGVGRTATNVSYRNDGSHWVGEVEEVMQGDQQIDEATYFATVAGNIAWDEMHPPVVPDEPEAEVQPSLAEQIAELKAQIAVLTNASPVTGASEAMQP